MKPTSGYLTWVSLLLFLIPMVAIVLVGVRARVHDGGGRGTGVCVRRVAVRRNDVE